MLCIVDTRTTWGVFCVIVITADLCVFYVNLGCGLADGR